MQLARIERSNFYKSKQSRMARAEVEDAEMKEAHECGHGPSLEQRSSSLGSLGDRMGSVTLVAKFGKERITLAELDAQLTVGQVKVLLQEQTRILPKRQKLVGLIAQQGGAKGVHDDLPLSELKVKGSSNEKTTNWICP